MDAKDYLFYGLGQLAYSIAIADGKVQPNEKKLVLEFIEGEMKKIEPDYDIASIIFQLLEKDHMDFESSYQWAIKSMQTGSHKMTSELKKQFLDVIIKVAKAFPPISVKEHEIIIRFEEDLKKL